jgi:hypothetical protein
MFSSFARPSLDAPADGRQKVCVEASMNRFLGWMGGAAIAAGLFVAPSLARADEDPTKLYDLSVKAPAKVAKGGTGTLTVRITPKGAGELHNDTPLSLAVTPSANVSFEKPKYARTDAKVTAKETSFEVPFTAKEKGAGKIESKVVFFICTSQLCARQERTETVNVAVE